VGGAFSENIVMSTSFINPKAESVGTAMLSALSKKSRRGVYVARVGLQYRVLRVPHPDEVSADQCKTSLIQGANDEENAEAKSIMLRHLSQGIIGLVEGGFTSKKKHREYLGAVERIAGAVALHLDRNYMYLEISPERGKFAHAEVPVDNDDDFASWLDGKIAEVTEVFSAHVKAGIAEHILKRKVN
jgi:hypothetical protein